LAPENAGLGEEVRTEVEAFDAETQHIGHVMVKYKINNGEDRRVVGSGTLIKNLDA